ncbi:hypothetical protein GCM10027347_57230 [Larkinella harenae]
MGFHANKAFDNEIERRQFSHTVNPNAQASFRQEPRVHLKQGFMKIARYFFVLDL